MLLSYYQQAWISTKFVIYVEHLFLTELASIFFFSNSVEMQIACILQYWGSGMVALMIFIAKQYFVYYHRYYLSIDFYIWNIIFLCWSLLLVKSWTILHVVFKSYYCQHKSAFLYRNEQEKDKRPTGWEAMKPFPYISCRYKAIVNSHFCSTSISKLGKWLRCFVDTHVTKTSSNYKAPLIIRAEGMYLSITHWFTSLVHR